MRFDAVVFDVGNTLVPWTERENARMYEALRPVFEEALGPIPDFMERAYRARDLLIREREAGSMREVTMEEFAGAIAGGRAPAGLPERVGRAMHEAFVAVCPAPRDLEARIARFAGRYRLAVLSNFCLTNSIEAVLERAGVTRHFETIEVSATHGVMKPHPLLFETVLRKLGARPDRTLMVGDNFWADIVGGKRAGMLTALTHEHFQGPTSDPRAPGLRADLHIRSLDELLDPA
jgi:putative hydrolase of the HAD superfamily